MDDSRRERIKQKVETAEARIKAREGSDFFDKAGERAIEAKDRFTFFAREHPLTTVAGALAVGILISSLFRNSPTRKLGNRAAGVAVIGAEAARAYLQQALDSAGHAAGQIGGKGAGRLDGMGNSIGDIARTLKRDGTALAGEAADTAQIAGRDFAMRVSQKVRNFRT